MRPAPFLAKWQLEPVAGGRFTGRLGLEAAWFAGHYPGAPIFPGSFLIEALVQAVLAARQADLGLEEIVSCRFQSPLFPGDVVAGSFALREMGGGRVLVEATASGRSPAAQVTMLLGPPAAPLALSTGAISAPPWSGRKLDAAFIEHALPHRAPALLIEEAVVLEGARPGLRARKIITDREPSLAAAGEGAFPAMLVLESFCQACGLLRAATAPVGEARDAGKAPVVAKLAGIRFGGEVGRGAVLEHRVDLVVRTNEGAVFAGHTAVAGQAVIEVKRVVAALAPVPPRG